MVKFSRITFAKTSFSFVAGRAFAFIKKDAGQNFALHPTFFGLVYGRCLTSFMAQKTVLI